MDNHPDSFRREPPSPLAPRPLSIPVPFETELANGLRLVIVEQSRLPLVSFRLAFRKGDAYDPPELPGLTDIMTHMLAEGTETRTSRQIADETARLGASLSAGATSDHMTVAASALTAYADDVFDLLADVALRPSFPADELELTKQNAQQNLIAQRGQASFLATEALARVLYGQHPYAVVSPTPESIDALTREMLADFHRAKFVPRDSVLLAVGDVRRDHVVRRAEELFGGWRSEASADVRFPEPPARDERVAYIVDRPGSAQSNIVIANIGITRTDPDYFPALVVHAVLGATASARLFMNLREEKGYTYGAYSSLDARRLAGSFRATAEVRTPVTGASLKEFFYELGRIRDEDVSEREMRDAKSYLAGGFALRIETQEGLVEQLGQVKMHGLPADYLMTYRDRVEAVAREDVRRVARRLVTPDRAAVVVVGDAKEIVEQVRPFASRMEIYDSTGRRKDEGAATEAATTTTTARDGGGAPAES